MDLKECIINLSKPGQSLEAILKQLQVPRSTVQAIVSMKCIAQFCHCHNREETANYPLLLRENWSGWGRVKQKPPNALGLFCCQWICCSEASKCNYEQECFLQIHFQPEDWDLGAVGCSNRKVVEEWLT